MKDLFRALGRALGLSAAAKAPTRGSQRATKPATAPRSEPAPLASGVSLTIRRADGAEDEDIGDILGFAAPSSGGAATATRLRIRSHLDDRVSTVAISRIVRLQTNDGGELAHPDRIALWLRELAGVATDADREAAGIAEADQAARDEIEDQTDTVLAHRLRVPAFITYVDGDGVETRRHITIVSLHGETDDDGTRIVERIEAYCHTRRAARTFFPNRIAALAEDEGAPAMTDSDAIDAWFSAKAKAKPARRPRQHG